MTNRTWYPDTTYCVDDTIYVSSLTILPGVNVIFFGDYLFQVDGILTAIGTREDSILFTKADADSVDGWAGIFFNHRWLSHPYRLHH